MAELDLSGLAPAVDEKLKKMHPFIKRKLMYQGESMQYVTAIPTENDGDYQIISEEKTEMFQQFNAEFTKKGKLIYSGDKIAMRRGKIDYSYLPQSYYDKIMIEIAKMVAESEQQGQEVNWEQLFRQQEIDTFIAKRLVEGALEDIETITLWNGTYKAPVAGRAGRAQYVADGLYTMLKKHIKSGKITPVAAGTFTDATFVDFTNDFLNEIDDRYQDVVMPMLMSKKNVRKYRQKYAEVFADSASERRGILNETRTELEGSGAYTQGVAGLRNKKILIATPVANIGKIVSPYVNASVQQSHRMHDFLMDIGFGLDFLYKPIVFVAGEMIEAPDFTATPVTSIATTSATVNILEVPEATGYEVERATNPDFTGSTIVQFSSPNATQENITLDDGDTLSYQFKVSQNLTGLTTGTTYYIRVRAKLQGAEALYTSANSKVISFTTL